LAAISAVAGVGRGLFGWQDERMPVRAFATHDLEVGEYEVVKRFRSWARVLFFRRAFAFFWLVNLLGAGDDRLDALRTQALRLLAMLDTG
jgi:hypothetical protein